MKILYTMCLTALMLVAACSKQEVEFGSTQTEFESIQIQKFDYISRSGTGKIYQGQYSENGDTVYFHVTYYPDEEAPSYTDWQVQASVYTGAKVAPSLSGIKDLSEPLSYTVTAPNGVNKSEVVLKLLIYEIDFKELDKGFGRYSKLFELTASQLGWSNANQQAMAVVGDELLVSNMDQPFLVYNKRTGEQVDRDIPLPAGANISSLFVDAEGILHATNYVSFSPSANGILNIYRWTNGLDKAPELFYQLPTVNIPVAASAGIGLNVSVAGSTQGNAQIMLNIDGRGTGEQRTARVAVQDGVPSGQIDIFNTGVETPWNGKTIPLSPGSRLPYVSAMLGFPAKLVYEDNTGSHNFIVDAGNSNFLNKIIAGACYFEFNQANYLAVSSISWPGDYRLLIFNLDDPTLINVGKAEIEKYTILNPFMEEATFMSTSDTGDVTVQVQPDGKTALVYLMGAGTGIMAFELTNIGSDKD